MGCTFIIDDDHIHTIRHLFNRNNRYNKITSLSYYKNLDRRRGISQFSKRYYKRPLRDNSYEKGCLISHTYPAYAYIDINSRSISNYGHSFSYLKIYHKQRFGQGISRAGRRKKRRIILGG